MNTAELLKDVIYNEKKPVITVLFETDFTKEIRIVMQKGTMMKEHKTQFPIVVEVVKGNINFGVNGNTHLLNNGSLITLNPNIPHDLKANEDSIIRLTLSKHDTTSRVENVVKS